MKLNQNLSPSLTPTQRWAPSASGEIRPGQSPRPTATECSARRRSPFHLLTTRTRKPVRIPVPSVTPRLVLRGKKSYLQALRAAEEAAWNASLKFPTF